MKDFFNQPLNINDEVATIDPYQRKLIIGKIIGATLTSTLNIQYDDSFFKQQITFEVNSNQVIKKSYVN